ncbi:thiolase family protein [Marisediminicola senii]|uniref:thiolase family protein n=1 Tax=Marisediminicola senii TaxID=2711233 RepID=UPI0013EA3D8E|nr:thiolase family protein [Marisediminicola senii]
MDTAVIVDAMRTPSGRGKPGGQLSHLHPVELLAHTLRALVDRTGIDPGAIDDVIGGCLSQVGRQSVNITRNAVLAAGFPDTVPGTTVDRQCGSSQQATAFAAQGVMAGAYDVVIACGVESMSQNPINSATLGLDPFGPSIGERYPGGLVGQGISAELIAARWGLDRSTLDEYAARSHRLAAASTHSADIVAVGDATTDETIRPGTTVEGLAGLAPAFRDDAMAARFPEIDWRITAGNSSPLTDGASAVLIMSERRATELGLTPRARFHSFAVTGSDPIEMLTGVIPVTRRILDRTGLGIDDIDSYEVNEAFACVPLAWQHEFGSDPERLNPRGGAIALGHPLGSSGTRLLTTLLGTLEQTGGRYGLQTMCEGGGMANATIIERL